MPPTSLCFASPSPANPVGGSAILAAGPSRESTRNDFFPTTTVKKSIAIVPARWLRAKVLQVCDGGRCGRGAGFGKYTATVSLSTACPSFASSLAILRRLQNGFSRAICSMRLTSSGASGGRPTGRDFHAHHRAKPRRCHAITVAGWTIARHSAHRDHRRETITQNARSIGRSRGPGVARRRIASCWRSTRFSANRIARGRSAANSAPTTASTIAFMTADHRPVHRRRHGRIGTLVRVRSPRAHLVDRLTIASKTSFSNAQAR